VKAKLDVHRQIVRRLPALRQAIAEGQYSHPRGLFYGGAGPSQMQHLLRKHLPRWLAGASLSFTSTFTPASGVGPHASCSLSIR